jgi:NAD(P)H-nitrite reductase large subunit
LGKAVVSIDKNKKSVKLDDQSKVEYDKLLIATGSRAFVPKMEGLETVKNKFTFMSLDDALSLDTCLTSESRVLILGAGLIGLKCAEGIYKKAGKITVVDLAPKILSSILDDDGAKMVQQHIEKQGIEFVLSQSVASFNKNTATLSNGAKIDFDVLVIAIG